MTLRYNNSLVSEGAIKDSEGNKITTTYAKSSSLATVATSGSYTDLTNTPTIPAAQVQSDWNETDTSSKAYIQNKPTIPSGVIVDQTYDGTSANAQSGVAIEGELANYALSSSVPTDTSDLTNNAGFITGINSSDVTTALGYTPADTTLSNLGATSSTNFDGQWVANKITALDAKTAGTTSYDLDNYLPSDYTTTPYLVYGILILSTNEVQDVTVKRSTTSDEYSVRVFCVSNSRRATTTFIMPMGYVDGALYRYIYKVQNGGTATYGSSVQLLAYRRIGTNT